MNRPAAPPPLGAYAQTLSAAGLCFFSGQVPVDPAGDVVAEDVTAQAEQVFTNLAACLASEGLSMVDVVSLTTYLCDVLDAPTVAAVRGRHLGDHRPTSTVVGVSELLDPRWRLEVQAVAVNRSTQQH
ncbi:RidA family protein [Nocardioides caldifontis]|uniref:RidA family protein n=1 Tax=Nocardioides caldifontis TaxID=2588938 RepID=UPI0013967F29|nr:RidA family protein [Nocardioides caldifontis]